MLWKEEQVFYHITYSVDKKIAVITLNWPERNNILDAQTVMELSDAFTKAQRDSNIRCVILRGQGDNFCAGMDETYLREISGFDFNQNMEESTCLMKLYQQIYALRKPVIALVQGNAFSTGCGLASVCDFVIAAQETARFGYTEIKMGLIPAIVMIFLVRKVGEGYTREFLLKGKILNSDEALKIGLINKIVPIVELEESGKELAEELMANNSGTSVGLIKELLARIHGMTTEDALEYASNLNALARMTDDSRKGIDSFLNSASGQDEK